MVEFKNRLKGLIGNLSPEQLSKELKGKNHISANTIRNYLKGDTIPNNFEKIQILANYFNVSTDYIQGLTDFKTKDIQIKYISEKYGLTEKSLNTIETFNKVENRVFNKTINIVNNYILKLLCNFRYYNIFNIDIIIF